MLLAQSSEEASQFFQHPFKRAFSVKNNIEFVLMEGKQNANLYIEALKTGIVPFADRHYEITGVS